MATVYAVASSKGGVGKTTTTVNLGATLASAGLSVAVVDGDIGMANLGDALGVDPDGATLHDVLAETADVEDAVYEGPAGLAVVPGDTSIDGFRAADPKNLADVLDALDDYDYVLVDTGAGLSHDTVLPLGLADEVVLVSTTERDSLTDTEKTREVVDRLGGSTRGVVLTCVDPDDPNAEEVAERLAADVIEAIPVDPVVRESMRLSDPLATYAPGSAAASAYRALAGGLTGESIPTPEAVDEEADATDEETATDESDGAETADADSEHDPTDADTEQDFADTDTEQDSADADTEEAGAAGDVTLDAPAAETEDEGITLTEPEAETTEEASTDEGSAGDDDESELAADGDSLDEAAETEGADEAASGADDTGAEETVDATDADDTEPDGAEESAADDADEIETEDADEIEAGDAETGAEDADETVADDTTETEADDTTETEADDTDEIEADEADDPSGLTDDDALAADTEPSDDPLVADSAEPDSDESEAEGEPVFTTSLVEEAEPTDDETEERETASDTDGEVDLVETDDEEEDDDSGRGFLGRLLG